MKVKRMHFQSITAQAKGIAYVYKVVGLYSVVFLTIVTVISMTNVFTSGEFAQWSWVKDTWAFVFAASIDVNIVRLFVESKVDKSISALWIGIGLGIVTGAALLIEGLQQSIGLKWTDQNVQIIIAILIGFRVVLVILLMAREGRKLGDLIQVTQEPQNELQNEVLAPVLTPGLPVSIELEKDTQDEPILDEQNTQSEKETSRRTMTIEEVINLTGLSERKVKNLIAKRTLKVSSRNQSLVLISSVEELLKNMPIDRAETGELVAVKASDFSAENHSNGHAQLQQNGVH